MLHPKTFWEMRGVLIRLLEGLSPSRAPLKSVYVSTFIELRPDISIVFTLLEETQTKTRNIHYQKERKKWTNFELCPCWTTKKILKKWSHACSQFFSTEPTTRYCEILVC